MAWTLKFAEGAERDFALIFDHLVDSYIGFGEPLSAALDHAENRVLDIRKEADRILIAPHRGSATDDILHGSHQLTLGQSTYWFRIDEAEQIVVVLAVFFGGQDTRRKMLLRLLEGPQ
ncbi:MAG: type II toxin-antitoxin system RelE/ParE family toxin [Cognatishimia sp.]|uniref:type II toxin-antitoxin system RelE/ParE family toxin n=1 Tax=Cognatishimia sp. TaxID=2211648 RepID=UPI003B8CD161